MPNKSFFLFFFLFFIALSSKAQVFINEYSAANLLTIKDDFSRYEDWVELYNSSNETLDISGYSLSDSPNSPKKWQFPKGTTIKNAGYVVVWCDGRDTLTKLGTGRNYHTNFKLTQTKKKAETLTLSDTSGKIIDAIKIQKTRANQSRGRRENEDSTWVIFAKPTPKFANSGKYFKGNAEKPEFNVKSGFYAAAQNIQMNTKEPNSTIYYTTNGAEPTLTNAKVYKDSLVVSKTTVVKAFVVSKDTLIQPSFTEFSTYFIDIQHNMKTVSITGGTTLESLANGTKALIPYGSFELFDESGERKATTFGEFNAHGQDSWVNKQRSLDFVSRDECGYDSAIKDKLFDMSERTEYQRIILRAAGDDNYPNGSGTKGGGAHLRDAFLQNIVKEGKMNLDVREGTKAVVYINAKYWGVYDLRERPEDHDYTEFNYGQGKYDLQYLQTWGTTRIEYGGDAALTDWKKFTDYVRKADLRDSVAYKYVTDRLDVKSLADYIITNSVSVCSDWINYNTGWWRGLNPEGTHHKWGYQLWDNDATFGYYRNYTHVPDTAANKAKPCHVELFSDTMKVVLRAANIAKDTVVVSGKTYFPGDTITKPTFQKVWVDLNYHMKIFSKLRQNPVYNQYYLTRYADLMNTVFSQENMLYYLDKDYQTIKPEMARHIAKWGGTMAEWEKNVAKLRNYIIRRTDYLTEGMKSCYQLTGPYDVTFEVEGTQDATLEINSQIVNKFPYVGKYFGNIDTKINAASPNTNLMFDAWAAAQKNLIAQDKQAKTSIKFENSDKITAKFVKAIIATDEKPIISAVNVVNVFPTVFNHQININYHLIEDAEVKVSLKDLNGRIILQANDFNSFHAKGDYNMSLDLSQYNLQNGMYLIDFQANKYHKIDKIIKIQQ